MGVTEFKSLKKKCSKYKIKMVRLIFVFVNDVLMFDVPVGVGGVGVLKYISYGEVQRPFLVNN